MAIISKYNDTQDASNQTPTRHDFEVIANLLKSLADPNRLVIVQHLALGEHRVTDLVEHLNLAQSTVSMHVASLRDRGLLASRIRGRATYYSLTEPELITKLLSAAAEIVSATAEDTLSCVDHGQGEE